MEPPPPPPPLVGAGVSVGDSPLVGSGVPERESLVTIVTEAGIPRVKTFSAGWSDVASERIWFCPLTKSRVTGALASVAERGVKVIVATGACDEMALLGSGPIERVAVIVQEVPLQVLVGPSSVTGNAVSGTSELLSAFSLLPS